MKKKNKRNYAILELALKGAKHKDIAKQYNITKQRVTQIIQAQGYTREDIRKKYFEPIVSGFQKKIENGACPTDVHNELKKIGYNLPLLVKYGLNYNPITFKEQRNKKIATIYKSGVTAKKILTDGVCGIGSLNGIYNTIKKQKAQRLPQVKRGKKGIYENNEIIKELLHLREIEKLPFREIAERLNEKGLKTMSGKLFSAPNVAVKYYKFYEYSEKKSPVKFKAKKIKIINKK